MNHLFHKIMAPSEAKDICLFQFDILSSCLSAVVSYYHVGQTFLFLDNLIFCIGQGGQSSSSGVTTLTGAFC